MREHQFSNRKTYQLFLQLYGYFIRSYSFSSNLTWSIFFFSYEVKVALQWHIQNSCFHPCCPTLVLYCVMNPEACSVLHNRRSSGEETCSWTDKQGLPFMLSFYKILATCPVFARASIDSHCCGLNSRRATARLSYCLSITADYCRLVWLSIVIATCYSSLFPRFLLLHGASQADSRFDLICRSAATWFCACCTWRPTVTPATR